MKILIIDVLSILTVFIFNRNISYVIVEVKEVERSLFRRGNIIHEINFVHNSAN